MASHLIGTWPFHDSASRSHDGIGPVLDLIDDGESMICCAPTAGGKSLFADIVALRRLLAPGAWRRPHPNDGGDRDGGDGVDDTDDGALEAACAGASVVLYVVPFVALVEEKSAMLKRVLRPLNRNLRRSSRITVRGLRPVLRACVWRPRATGL